MPRRPLRKEEQASTSPPSGNQSKLTPLLLVIAVVSLVPESFQVNQFSARSLSIPIQSEREQTNETNLQPVVDVRVPNATATSHSNLNEKVSSSARTYVTYEDFPLKEDGLSNLKFPSEEEWLLPPYPHDKGSTTIIPKLLHKIIFNQDGEFPPNFFGNSNDVSQETKLLQQAHKTWRDYNPDYTIKYYNLRLARLYLSQHYHAIFLRAFDCIEAFAGKADFFRYAVLYREGGFYSDWKQQCKVNGLLDQLAQNCTWFSAQDRGLPKHWRSMSNGFLGAHPRHPVLAETIHNIFANLLRKLDEENVNIFLLTGPLLLGRAVKKLGLKAGVKGVKIGYFKAHNNMRYYFPNRYTNIILHKCHGCGGSNWTSGNNYHEKFAANEYFCPDAASLLTTSVWLRSN